MKQFHFSSNLSTLMELYLTTRTEEGYLPDHYGYYLQELDCLSKAMQNESFVTRELVEAWDTAKPYLSNRTKIQRHNTIRKFAAFAFAIRLTNPAMVTLTGKGRKARQVPLMKETCKLLDAYTRNFNLNSEPMTSPLFFNQKGQALSRYGITYILKKYVSQAELDSDTRKISPHVLRHTKAMHLLRAGVNMIYIRDFLGHVDISTTEVYARIDAESI